MSNFGFSENVKSFLRENPKIASEIENRILENAGMVEKAMMEGDAKEKATKEEDNKIKDQ